MKSVTQMKSLGDIRTTISTHTRSTPRQKGSTYLEVYLLDKEKQRLETEMEMLAKRRKRIQTRLADIYVGIEALTAKVRREAPISASPAKGDSAESTGGDGAPRSAGAFRKVTVEY